MRHAAPIAAIGLLCLAACAATRVAESQLFTGHERTYLTLNLAQNTTELDLLRKLHDDDSQGAIEALQFELDARVLFLSEVLADHGRHPVVREKSNLIACHLHAISQYREQHGVQSKYPEIAEMASEALRNAPRCECSKSRTDELASQPHATSGCS